MFFPVWRLYIFLIKFFYNYKKNIFKEMPDLKFLWKETTFEMETNAFITENIE